MWTLALLVEPPKIPTTLPPTDSKDSRRQQRRARQQQQSRDKHAQRVSNTDNRLYIYTHTCTHTCTYIHVCIYLQVDFLQKTFFSAAFCSLCLPLSVRSLTYTCTPAHTCESCCSRCFCCEYLSVCGGRSSVVDVVIVVFLRSLRFISFRFCGLSARVCKKALSKSLSLSL